MRKVFLAIVVVACVSTTSYARGYYRGYAHEGGQAVSTSFFQSRTSVQRSFPSATVKVCVAGTSCSSSGGTAATLYSTNTGTALANPMTAGSDGSFAFYTDTNLFDIVFYGAGITTSCGTSATLPCISSFTWASQTFNGTNQLLKINVLDFGAVCDGTTDATVAVQAAANAVPVGGAGIVEFPSSPAGCKLTAVVTIPANREVILRGVGMAESGVKVSGNGISAFQLTDSSYFKIQDMFVIGPGATSTAVGVKITNTHDSTFENAYITSFDTGIRFYKGSSGSYNNRILTSYISGNVSYDIYGEQNTNALYIAGSTVGGAGAITSVRGIYLVDSNSFTTIGSDYEGCTTAAIDIDNTVGNVLSGFDIIGCHFESNASSVGDIRLGLTNVIRGINIIGNIFSGTAPDTEPISATKVNGMHVAGNSVLGVYATSTDIVYGAAANVVNVNVQGNETFKSQTQWFAWTFATLGTPSQNGVVKFCSDCTKTTPCANAGGGAFAKYVAAAWDCN